VCGWQVKLCDPLVTQGPYMSTLEVQHNKALYKFTLLYFTLLYFAVWVIIALDLIRYLICPVYAGYVADTLITETHA